MIRLYGEAPYKTVLLHGGPGAIGALKGVAKELSALSRRGVVEPIQSKYSIAELVEELYFQIKETCEEKVTLIGHSWGAFLAIFFAKEYPQWIEKVVLVGCPPLEDQYVHQISSRRLQYLSDEDAALFKRLISHEATEEDMKKVPVILERSDNYCLVDKAQHLADDTDHEMLNKVWAEAATLRTNGEIIATIRKVKSKIYLIQGKMDPHPAEGVIMPLQGNGISCTSFILDRCGHSPYMEEYAKDAFYKILLQIME